MVIKKHRRGTIRADVIVLGCSLPGIVTAYKLRKKFGNTMDIVVLDLAGASRVVSRCNVAFQEDVRDESDEEDKDEEEDSEETKTYDLSPADTAARQHLLKYADEFRIPIPTAIIDPTDHSSPLDKLFQYSNGSAVRCSKFFDEFNYLNFIERFELNQYQDYLDTCVKRLFNNNKFDDASERAVLQYYDRTTMEQNICAALFFSTPRKIMRMTVELVCGAPASTVSLLFYLHQCYRTRGTRHHLGRQNTRFREKLLGYCRKRLSAVLQANIADITMTTKPIRHIRMVSEADVELVILESMTTTYMCNLLALAIKPDQLKKIEVDDHLLPENEAKIANSLSPGKAKKFLIQYEENFWERQGYSGDILSLRGPILWAMERPRLSQTGSVEKYAALIGYVMVKDDESEEDTRSAKEAVIEQLKNLFGWEAESPVTYRETPIPDVFIPRCGDYIGLRSLTSQVSPRKLEWGAFDVFADGDVSAALEAGHMAYLHLLSCLRPQAQTYEDISTSDWPTILGDGPFGWWFSHINFVNAVKLSVYTTVLYVGVKMFRSFITK